MQVLIQRVSEADCLIDEAIYSSIGKGFVLFVSFHHTDDERLIPKMAQKIARLRIFEDDLGKMNLSLLDLGLEVLSISQFTLEANTEKGHRPSFTEALEPEKAEALYTLFNTTLEKENVPVKTGIFGAMMRIRLVNDGPVTLLLKRRH